MTGINTVLLGAACIWIALWVFGVTLQHMFDYPNKSAADWIASFFIMPLGAVLIMIIVFMTPHSVPRAIYNAQRARNERPEPVPRQQPNEQTGPHREPPLTDEENSNDDATAGLDLDTDTGF